MPGLTLVGRQTPTEGGPLDLLGVDSDGRLAVFELKRGALSRDAVAQIIDYASDLDRMELGALAEHISERSGEHGIEKIEDFEEWYNQEFGDQGLEALKPLRLFLVGLGADDRTERMVTFLAKQQRHGHLAADLPRLHASGQDPPCQAGARGRSRRLRAAAGEKILERGGRQREADGANRRVG